MQAATGSRWMTANMDIEEPAIRRMGWVGKEAEGVCSERGCLTFRNLTGSPLHVAEDGWGRHPDTQSPVLPW